jgi:hypothetical protein
MSSSTLLSIFKEYQTTKAQSFGSGKRIESCNMISTGRLLTVEA